jgi:hypothetical protein
MKELCELYFINNIDILNFKASKTNYITYHHIIHVEDLKSLGFETTKTIENGLALTKIAHSYLHLIEDEAPDIFYHLNKIILLITKERRLPTLEERNLMQIFLEAFEYRMNTYYDINPIYLKRVLVS